ncbi:hypothetical protein D9M68_955720 [compost metagenome]
MLALIEALCGAVAHRAERPVKAAAEMTEFLLPWLYGTPGADRADRAGRAGPAGPTGLQPTEEQAAGATRRRASNPKKS